MSALLVDLLAALAGAPALPGARCRGRPHLFDPARPAEAEASVADRHRQALALCAACPSLRRCAAWLDSLPPSKRPAGVVAGTVRG